MAAPSADQRLHHKRDADMTDEPRHGRSTSLAPRRLLVVAGVIGAAALLGAVAIAPGCVPEKPVVPADTAAAPPNERFTINGEAFTLEVARDNKAREKGLGGRSSLAPDAGMIFIFPRAEPRAFWMLDTEIDLDIIYVDPLGFVTAVYTMPAEPPRRKDESIDSYRARLPRYPSVAPAQFAIELAAGKAKELGIKPNQKLPGEWDRLKKLAK